MRISRLRFKIRWFMMATVALAVVLGVMASPFDPVPLILFLVPIGIFLAFALYVALVVAPYVTFVSVKACPSCRARAIECLAFRLRPLPSSVMQCRCCKVVVEHQLFKGWLAPLSMEPGFDELLPGESNTVAPKKESLINGDVDS